MTADLVLKGGLVVDGTGRPGEHDDVAITDGRISAIGRDLDGDTVLDATDHVVAPGFIDIHTHYDAQVFWDPALTPSCFHGVTTVVGGNCGFSFAPTQPEHRQLLMETLQYVEDMNLECLTAGLPWDFTTFPEFLSAVERTRPALNFSAFVGHTAIRLFVMGYDGYERRATADEVQRMREVLREALLAGAAGFSTSLSRTHCGVEGKPIPSRVADEAELRSLLDVMRQVGRGVVEIAAGQLSVEEIYSLQPVAGVPITIGALDMLPTKSLPRVYERVIELNRRAWTEGVEVWPQVTQRPVALSVSLAQPYQLNVNPEFSALASAPSGERRRAYGDPDWRHRAQSEFATREMAPRWETYQVSECTSAPGLVGRPLLDVARERSVDPFDALLDLALAEPDLELRVRCIVANDDEVGVAQMLREQHCTLGLSDAGAHVGVQCDSSQASDFLGAWARDRALMPIEQAVRKLTGVQADLFQLAGRGYLKPGSWGDVVVFDPATIAEGPIRRVRDLPAGADRLMADRPTGVRHVVVNGVPIRVDGDPVTPTPRAGHVIRGTSG
jgi:N-acyl-D-aspartate/D-glutamate deacylase